AAAHACSLKGDLECALAGYRSAYQQRPNPRVLFNVAQLRRKLGRYGEAAADYRTFLAQAEKPRGGPPQKELIAEARLQLANCERRMVPQLPQLSAAPAAVPPPLLPPEVPGPTRPYGLSAPRADEQPWRVTVFLGGGRSHEEYTESTTVGRLGLQGTYSFAGNWMAALTGDWRSSQQQYAPFNGP